MAETKKGDLSELSTEELANKKKSLKTLLGVLWSLCGLYIIYIAYRLFTMESGEDIGVLAPLGGGLAVLGGVSAVTGGQLTKLKAEEKRREQEA